MRPVLRAAVLAVSLLAPPSSLLADDLRARAEAFIAKELNGLPPGERIEKIVDGAYYVAGDLFRAGHDVAVVALTEKAEGSDVADTVGIAFASRQAGQWEIRDIDAEDHKNVEFQPYWKESKFEWRDLNDDEIPEVLVPEYWGSGGMAFSVYIYNPDADRLSCASRSLGNPNRRGAAVMSHWYCGQPCQFFRFHRWEGRNLVERWSIVQKIEISPNTPPEERDSIFLLYQEYDVEGKTQFSFRAIGTVSGMTDGRIMIDTGLPEKFTIYAQVGDHKRTYLIRIIHSSKDDRVRIEFAELVSHIVCASREQIIPGAEVITDDGRAFRLSDIADVTVIEGWPPGVSIPEDR